MCHTYMVHIVCARMNENESDRERERDEQRESTNCQLVIDDYACKWLIAITDL